jgi:hypothetical protein
MEHGASQNTQEPHVEEQHQQHTLEQIWTHVSRQLSSTANSSLTVSSHVLMLPPATTMEPVMPRVESASALTITVAKCARPLLVEVVPSMHAPPPPLSVVNMEHVTLIRQHVSAQTDTLVPLARPLPLVPLVTMVAMVHAMKISLAANVLEVTLVPPTCSVMSLLHVKKTAVLPVMVSVMLRPMDAGATRDTLVTFVPLPRSLVHALLTQTNVVSMASVTMRPLIVSALMAIRVTNVRSLPLNHALRRVVSMVTATKEHACARMVGLVPIATWRLLIWLSSHTSLEALALLTLRPEFRR